MEEDGEGERGVVGDRQGRRWRYEWERERRRQGNRKR